MAKREPYYILGMDPGIASCGFALIDTNNQEIVELGVHLFDTPQEPKTKVSLATTRRNARGARRNNARTKARQKHALKLFKEYGLVPEDATREWLQSTKGDKPIIKLRANGLDRLLNNREFAQVLYALVSRRGYIPHGGGKHGETDDLEGRKVLKAIKENSKEMSSKGYRTVGEMLYLKGTSRNKGGDYSHVVLNRQLIDETKLLFEAQRTRGSSVASSDFEEKYIECLTWEKSTLDRDTHSYQLVGNCSYFPTEKRAARADFSSELCSAYEKFGHLVIEHADGSEQRLTPQERDLFLTTLFSPVAIKGNKECKVTYSSIRRTLDLPATSVFKGITGERENKSEPFAPKAWRSLRKNLGTEGEELLRKFRDDRELADRVCEALTFASTEESLLQRLSDLDVDLSDAEIDLLPGIPFGGKVFKGYGNRSLKALNILLDIFESEDILTLTDAERASGLLDMRLAPNSEKSGLLPLYETYDKTCTNPVVLRSMSRMRKIVNSIIKLYGVPHEIHIELDRDLKHSLKEKNRIRDLNNENERNRVRWREQASGILGIDADDVPGSILRKLALHEEQGGFDVYTGDKIELERLVRDEYYTEIDHVLPYSRTCDNSQKNKVLVLSKSNQDKKERTPYEWMTSGEASAPSWDAYCARVANSEKLQRKRRNLLNTSLGEDDEKYFISRNLNDTRYMSRAIKNFIADSLQFPEGAKKSPVIAVAGGATANLRWVWGLNYGKDNTKDREDDRHHAVDAAVIAACSESTIIKVARASSKGYGVLKRQRESRLADTQPWETFAVDLDKRREEVVPTRMANHGVTGRAFQDTIYRFEGFTDDGKEYAKLAGESRPQGNVRISEDGKSAQIVDGMAFLRVWLDPDAKNGKKQGRWYAEPVYYADIPEIQAGRHVPRAQKNLVARNAWTTVPDSAMQLPPLVIFHNDVLSVDGVVARYDTFGIAMCQLFMKDVRSGDEFKGFPTINSWTATTDVHIISEDCLGHCYKGLFD